MKKIPFLILLLLLGYLLVGRFLVGSMRFFDADEFTFLHWAAGVARGERLYVDIITYFSPGFFWFLAPLFWVFGKSVSVFLAARVAAFLVFLGMVGGLGYLFGITRGWKWALLPMGILAFLPLPYEKFLEVRPDNLAMLLGVLGVLGILKGRWFLAGLAYSASLFVLAKTLPIVAVGAGVALFYKSRRFFVGLIVPWIIFFVWQGIWGNFSTVWYALVQLPFEASQGAIYFPMEQNLFFWPNWWVYGGAKNSINMAFIVNHTFWLFGLGVAAYRLVTSRSRNDFLVAVTFWISVFAYAKFFPLKHAQYLIPIAFFIAYYSADGLSLLFNRLYDKKLYSLLVGSILVVGLLMGNTDKTINKLKIQNTHAFQLNQLQTFMSVIPTSARVVDLEGRMVFWADGYPISGLPFDIFLPFMSRPPLPLSEHITKYPVDYIYFGQTGRRSTLSPTNGAYLERYFLPVSGFGDELWKRK